ncbi:histidine kinase [Paraburkholderia ginsengiterrae]|uniref:Oxygen sensor histidine kinase NreB n=1 Tax=Paraburkholderia ginsengiterrae TaxID=1462993 RepID=A0A1A9N0Y6_9BURK|nr:PAS domain-containing sensor histidine kinase [Paraburkholderia ginsengiterrae]OAJ53504.1 histidine kinase [Paraburkholderia ginsengiterrae]OAJ59056.1 histidine kinase [Paraburkholderia ginsengiterrae]
MGPSSSEPSRFAGAASVSDVPLEDRYFLLIEAVEDYAIFMLDTSGCVTSWNPGAQRIKGYTPDEIIGQHFSAFYTPEDIAAGKPTRELEIAAAKGRVEDEGWRVRRDGSRFWANVVISAVCDASGALLGFAKVTRDMTERMRLAELERAVEVTTQVQITRENEQKRIARELHDDLGQQLTALKMSVALLESNLADQTVAASLISETHELQTQIDSMVASLRRIAADLRPPLLDDLGLTSALDWLAEDFVKRYGVDVTVHVESDEPAFNEFASTTLFRIVQEALTNVARHASASRVRIEMACAEDTLSLEIEDNGMGVALDRPPEKTSFGLLGIRERVRQLQGSVSFFSSPGSGFRISIRVPLAALE